MKLNGVPTSGKRIALIDGVTVQLPSGAVYGKDKDGDVFCGVLDSRSATYCDGAFSVPDDVTFNWRIAGCKENNGLFGDIELGSSPSGRKLAIQQVCDKIVEANSSSEKIKNEPYEFGSSTKVEETEDGMRITSSIQTRQSNGQGGRYTLNDRTELMIIEKRMSLMGATFSFFIGVIVIDTGSTPLAYQATLSARGEGLGKFEKAIIPVLKTVQYDSSARVAADTTFSAQMKSTSTAEAIANRQKAQKEAATKKQAEDERQKAEQGKELSQLQAQIKTFEQTKAQKEEKLRSLGLFKGAEKKALRNEIESLQNDIATARNKAEKLRILVTAEPVEYNDGPMSDEMKTLVRQLSWELGSGPKTAFELGLTNLHAANAVKHIENVYRVRVTRERTNAKGERKIVEETAYFIK